MPETIPSDSVTVVFRKNDSLIIPPFGLPYEKQLEGESYEATANRLSLAHGTPGNIDRVITYHNTGSGALRAYVMLPLNNEFDRSPFRVYYTDILEHIDAHTHLNIAEKKLLRHVHLSMTRRSV